MKSLKYLRHKCIQYMTHYFDLLHIWSIILWRHSGVVFWSGVGSCLGSFWLALPRACFSVLFFGHTLSEGRGCFPRPTGSLTARILVNGGSAPPRVSTSFLDLCQSSPGTVPPFLHWLVSAGPRALAETRPLGHSPAFPHPKERHFYFVDSFIGRTSQKNAQTKSIALTPIGHTFSG